MMAVRRIQAITATWRNLNCLRSIRLCIRTRLPVIFHRQVSHILSIPMPQHRISPVKLEATPIISVNLRIGIRRVAIRCQRILFRHHRRTRIALRLILGINQHIVPIQDLPVRRSFSLSRFGRLRPSSSSFSVASTHRSNTDSIRYVSIGGCCLVDDGRSIEIWLSSICFCTETQASRSLQSTASDGTGETLRQESLLECSRSRSTGACIEFNIHASEDLVSESSLQDKESLEREARNELYRQRRRAIAVVDSHSSSASFSNSVVDVSSANVFGSSVSWCASTTSPSSSFTSPSTASPVETRTALIITQKQKKISPRLFSILILLFLSFFLVFFSSCNFFLLCLANCFFRKQRNEQKKEVFLSLACFPIGWD